MKTLYVGRLHNQFAVVVPVWVGSDLASSPRASSDGVALGDLRHKG